MAKYPGVSTGITMGAFDAVYEPLFPDVLIEQVYFPLGSVHVKY